MKSTRSIPAIAGLALIALAPALLVTTGCGSDRASSSATKQASSAPRTQAPPASAVQAVAAQVPEARTVAAGSSAVRASERAAISESEAMPPDILVTVSDTLVTPGDVVDLVVRATVDVSRIELFDGLNDRQAFVYDSDAKAWRVRYRVPLGLPWQRVGLSVTARNDADRWRRVWVFLRVSAEGAEAKEASEGAADPSAVPRHG